MTYGMSGRRKFKETVGMSFTLGNIPQNVMCPLQEIYRTCKNGMSSTNHALQKYRKFHFLSSVKLVEQAPTK